MKKIIIGLLVLFVAILGAAPVFADAYTKLLIHSDDTDGSTSFTDSSSSGYSITAAGNSHHETDQAKIGQSSMYFDGSGDYISTPYSAYWNFGSGDWTLDFWAYVNNVAAGTGFCAQ